jgi:hypothetical protein
LFTFQCVSLQALCCLLEAPGRGLDWLLLELQPHHDAVLQAARSHQQQQQEQQQHIETLPGKQPSCLKLLLSMAAEATSDQLQELLLRLLQIAAGRPKPSLHSSSSRSSSVAKGAAVALCCMFWSAGPHAYCCGLILCQSRSRELLQDACRNSSSRIVQAAAAGMLSRPFEQLLKPALQACPEKVGATDVGSSYVAASQ